MLVRAAILAGASVLAAAGYAGVLPAGWAALAWMTVAMIDVIRTIKNQRRFNATTEEVAVAKAFAKDAYEGFQRICEACPVFVWVGDIDGNIEFVNKAFREFLGVETMTVDWRGSIHPDDMKIGEQYVADLQIGMEPPPMFCRILRADGEWRWLWAVSRAQGVPVRRLVGMGIDATAWKDAEHELAALVEAKQNFLQVMSHELRTPLTAIIGYCGLLREGLPAPLPPEDIESVEKVEEAAVKLKALVDEVLLFNSLENAQERVTIRPVDPKQVVMDVQDLLQPRARQLGLALVLDLTYAPKTVDTDEMKLRRVLVNLVNNALKFTKKGAITIRVVEDERHVYFSVIDPGVGLDVAAQRHVFEPFWQARQSMVREVGGMGLGLAVCHRIAPLLGGVLSVESQPDYGSTFTLTLPK